MPPLEVRRLWNVAEQFHLAADGAEPKDGRRQPAAPLLTLLLPVLQSI
jgi:hypothetical protein